jgi:uncharacterized protein (UPF0216 family)
VTEKKSLSRLLEEAEPSTRTQEGDLHPFDREALRRFAEVLTVDEAAALRLPVTIRLQGESDEAILSDAIGAKALRALEKLDRAFPFRDGRMAVPHSLAVDLVRRYGGVLQLAFG